MLEIMTSYLMTWISYPVVLFIILDRLSASFPVKWFVSLQSFAALSCLLVMMSNLSVYELKSVRFM